MRVLIISLALVSYACLNFNFGVVYTCFVLACWVICSIVEGPVSY